MYVFVMCIGEPLIQQPQNSSLIFPTSIILTCGEDVTVQSLVNITVITFLCNVYNGSHPLTWKLYKDGELTQYNSTPVTIYNATDSAYGTYAFVLSSTDCGSDIAVSRILQQGQFLLTYHMVGNFHGSKFSWFGELTQFHRFIFSWRTSSNHLVI